MKKFKVTLLIPQERVIEAPDMQDAHNQVTSMLSSMRDDPDENPSPKVHSIIEVVEQESIDFGPIPIDPSE